MGTTTIAVLVGVGSLILGGVIAWFANDIYRKKVTEKKVGSAEEKAQSIIDQALKEAETEKREILVKTKEEAIRTKNEIEHEARERRAELQRSEKRLEKKEDDLDKKIESLEKKENRISTKEAEIDKLKDDIKLSHDRQLQELERISGFTSDQAKEYLLKSVEEEVRHDKAVIIKELENQAKDEANKKAKDIILTAIQKCAVDHVAESTISVVQLPNDDMKGRIIGREGRNIKSFEHLTGVELIIDDTPDAVVLSGFDPVKREIARIALERLIFDGRIHQSKIEEMIKKSQDEVEQLIIEAGEDAALEVGITNLNQAVIKLLGRMKYRTSYGQNALKHSIEVSLLSGLLASEIGADVRLAKRAGLLHDIGKSIDREEEGSHVKIGADICRKYKENQIVINAVEAHHNDVEPTSPIAFIVQAADAISAARPGARKDTLENYTNRLHQLEEISNSFEGVEKSFAIQAGREIRVLVMPEKINDDSMVILARDIAQKIEQNLDYPGQIKVSVIRESRAFEYAK